jgi:hypothetical protein
MGEIMELEGRNNDEGGRSYRIRDQMCVKIKCPRVIDFCPCFYSCPPDHGC